MIVAADDGEKTAERMCMANNGLAKRRWARRWVTNSKVKVK